MLLDKFLFANVKEEKKNNNVWKELKGKLYELNAF